MDGPAGNSVCFGDGFEGGGGRACSFCLFVTQSLSPRPVEGSSQWTRLGGCETFVVLVLTLYVGRYRTFVFSAQFGVFMA